MVSRFVRRVRTASGSVAVQVVSRQGRTVIGVDHVGSARTDAELALLLAVAQERLRPGQGALDLGEVEAVSARMDDIADWTSPGGSRLRPEEARRPGPSHGRGGSGGGVRQATVVATSSLLLWDVLTRAYAELGFDALGDNAFRAMVLARIVEPTSKADTVRVLAEIGVACPTVRTLFRSLSLSGQPVEHAG